MSEPLVPLSVLDLSPVPTGVATAEALRRTLDLARHVERWGYGRYWVAEHHNMPGIASSAPAVLVGQVASATSTMRVGSGGVMLPNHVPLVVAEQFGMLEAIYPGRIDLGIGRAPGTDRVTARALRRNIESLSDEDFPEQLAELREYFAEPRGERTARTARPASTSHPCRRQYARGLAARVERLQRPIGGIARVAVRFCPPFQLRKYVARSGVIPPGVHAVGRSGRALLLDQRFSRVRARMANGPGGYMARRVCRCCACGPAIRLLCPPRRKRPSTPTTMPSGQW